MESSRIELLTNISSMYFIEGLTQKKIADKTGYSRSMVSRLLTEAQEQELVEVRIHHPLERCRDLEQELQKHFGLKMARVLSFAAMKHYRSSQPLGMLAARIVEEQVHDNMTIGVSWGGAVLSTINAQHSRVLSNIRVVQMVGLLGLSDPQIDGHELARRLACAFTGTYSILPAPLFVKDEATRLALLSHPLIQTVLESAKHADLALLGVGTLELDHCTLYHNGYLSKESVHELTEAGAVGDVCCNFLDVNGNSVDVPLARRVVGIGRDELANISTKLVVAAGAPKIKPILAAMRAGLVNILVTDEIAASGILEILMP
jgi:deoxyribonucleoside regulator